MFQKWELFSIVIRQGKPQQCFQFGISSEMQYDKVQVTMFQDWEHLINVIGQSIRQEGCRIGNRSAM